MINFWAVLVAAIASMAIGSVWYSQRVFGRLWMRYVHVTERQIKEAKKEGMTWAYVWTFFGSVVMSYVLAFFLRLAGVELVTQGLTIAFWTWLGFVMPTNLGSIFFEGKPAGLYWINATFNLVVLFIMSIILVLWR